MVGEDHRRPVLPEGAQPGEQQARPDPLRRARQADLPEPREFPSSETGGEIEERRVNPAESGACDEDEERRGHEALRQHDARHRVGQIAVEQTADRRVGPDDVDEKDARHERWQRERKGHDEADEGRPPRPRPGEEVGERDPENAMRAVEIVAVTAEV